MRAVSKAAPWVALKVACSAERWDFDWADSWVFLRAASWAEQKADDSAGKTVAQKEYQWAASWDDH